MTDKFTPSVYDAEEAALELANTFLKPDSFSTLKSGFLGFMTGNMARISAEGVHHRNIFYHENFLNTASMPRSIFNYAKIYNHDIGLAKSSSCRILFGLYLDSIQDMLGASTGVIELSRYQEVFLGNTPFLIAGKVRLVVLDGGRVSAEYDLREMNFMLPNQSEHIRTYVAPQVVDSSGTTRTVVYMELHIYQTQARASEFQVITNNALENSFYKVTIPANEQLASFRIMYKRAIDSSFREIEQIFNEAKLPDRAEYAYYSFTTNNELEIYFSPLPGAFRPAYNSRLRVEFITTSGALGNFEFTGTPTANLIGSNAPTILEIVTTPAGGYNGETLMEVKQAVMRKILERNNISIELDLENYLNGAIGRTEVNGSTITFIKRRDDIQKRLFASFLLLKDSAGRIVPTNTADLDFEAADLEERGWSIRPGTLVVYDPKNRIFRLSEGGEYPDRMVSDPNAFVYAIPFLMQFRVQPYPHLVYYRNQIDIDAPLQSLPGDAIVADSFIANSVTVKRNSTFDNTYQIDFTVSSNLDVEGLSNKCLVRVAILSKTGEDLGYVEANHVEGTNIFRAIVSTEDKFDFNNKLILTNSLNRTEDNILLPEASIPEDIKLRIELYYDNQSVDTNMRHVVRNGIVYQLSSVFQTLDPLQLYQELSRVVFSDMYVTEDGTFHCKNVPLIGASFYLNPRIGQEIVTIMSRFYSAVFEIFNLLHNNTSVDIKLYNTYGPSRLYNLDRPNISLKFDVKARGKASNELRQAIIAQTAKFVKDCNGNSRSRFSISNLITHLESTIMDISYLRFVSLNGAAVHNTEIVYEDTVLERGNKRIPEFLNVATILRSSLDEDPYVPDVTVNFI